MRYKGFIFPHNPHKIQISGASNMVRLGVPGLGEISQCLGNAGRIITGEGIFYGAKAEGQCKKLQELQREDTPGYLFLPANEPIKAFFTELTILCQGDGQAYSYFFEFTEDNIPEKGGQKGGSANFYSVNT